MVNIECVRQGYAAKEWPDGGPNKNETDEKGKPKHRIYIVGPEGEYGYYDLKQHSFKRFPKCEVDFGIVDDKSPFITLQTKRGKIIHLGVLNDGFGHSNKTINNDNPQDKLKDAIKRFEGLKHEGSKIEINVGPSKEIKLNGRSNWIRANLSVSIENPSDIETLYECVSDMANYMLEIEEQRLRSNKKY
tara:strand:- start:29 stop:595 length:567 start_codon:yes stop_codon:yes gene_type:complete